MTPSNRVGKPYLLIFLLLTPGVGFLVVFFAFPVIKSVINSFGIGLPEGWTLKYYQTILTDPLYFKSLLITLYYGIAPLVISLVISVPLAALLQSHFYGKKTFIGLYKIPLAIPGLVTALLTILLFGQAGWLNRLLMPWGVMLPKVIRDPFSLGVIISLVWKKIPFMTLIISGSMGAISNEIFQASRTLGAGRIKTFFYITIPLAMPGISAATILTFISSLGAFEVPNLLGKPYPFPLSILMYQHFIRGEWGYVFSIGVVITLMAILILFLYYTFVRSQSENHGS